MKLAQESDKSLVRRGNFETGCIKDSHYVTSPASIWWTRRWKARSAWNFIKRSVKVVNIVQYGCSRIPVCFACTSVTDKNSFIYE